jgi:hypothetical protein
VSGYVPDNNQVFPRRATRTPGVLSPHAKSNHATIPKSSASYTFFLFSHSFLASKAQPKAFFQPSLFEDIGSYPSLCLALSTQKVRFMVMIRTPQLFNIGCFSPNVNIQYAHSPRFTTAMTSQIEIHQTSSRKTCLVGNEPSDVPEWHRFIVGDHKSLTLYFRAVRKWRQWVVLPWPVLDLAAVAHVCNSRHGVCRKGMSRYRSDSLRDR